MTQKIRIFLFVQAAAFLTAALTHFGVIAHGYEHSKAGTAESVIGSVLVAALIFSAIRPASTRAVALAAQGFALLGTIVGLFTIAIGVGPRTAPDLVFHGLLIVLLLAGLITTAKAHHIGAAAESRS